MARAEKLVLVGVVSREKDLKTVLEKRWYRIPVRHAPRRRPDFVAFYQTLAFGREGKAICYYAPVKKISVTTRQKLLPEERNHPRAGNRYYKVELGPPKKTPRRIENRSRRRISFGFTTLGKLLKAAEVSHLFGISPIEEMMRRALRRKRIPASHEYCVMHRRRCRYRLDFAIFCKKGKIAVECDSEKWHLQRAQRISDRARDRWLKNCGWTVLHFPGDDIRKGLGGCVGIIRRTVCYLGGVVRADTTLAPDRIPA